MSSVSLAFLIVFAIVLKTGNTQPMSCGTNEEISLCGPICPPTCSSPQPQVCPEPCIIGCQCKMGYFRNSSGDCVLLSDC